MKNLTKAIAVITLSLAGATVPAIFVVILGGSGSRAFGVFFTLLLVIFARRTW